MDPTNLPPNFVIHDIRVGIFGDPADPADGFIAFAATWSAHRGTGQVVSIIHAPRAMFQ